MGALSTSAKVVREAVLELEEEILLGRLFPRERLVEENLAGRFDISRHAVRQVLAELENAGLVVRGAGTGVTVRELSSDEVNQLYAIRELLETSAARLIPLPVDPAELERIRRIATDYATAVEERNMRGVIRANKLFHETIYQQCGNVFMSDTINRMAQKSNLVRFSSSIELSHLERARDEHFAMVAALAQKDNDHLAELCLAHLLPARIHYLERHKLTT